MPKPWTIAIIGAGRFGRMLTSLIQSGNTGAAVKLWDKRVGLVPNQSDLAETIKPADIIIFCVPGLCLREAFEACREFMADNVLLISVAKGLEPGSGWTTDEILNRLRPGQQRVAVLGGPMMAEELRQGHSVTGILASEDPDIFMAVMRLFAGTNLTLEPSSDPRGVSLAGVIKNVYAYAVGLADGLKWTSADRQQLLARASEEMIILADMLELNVHTINGPAGFGDFQVTATSENSHHRRAGEEFIHSGQFDNTCEAVSSFHWLRQSNGGRTVGHIFTALGRIIVGQEEPRTVFTPEIIFTSSTAN